MKDERYERGMTIRREMFGEEYVSGIEKGRTSVNSDFRDLVASHVYGEIWSRPGLDRRTRSCIVVSMLIALGRFEELALHIRGALSNGVTEEELLEILLQSSVYAGVPAANVAFGVAKEVLGKTSA